MNWYELAFPLIRNVDPELAHGVAIKALAAGFVPTPAPVEDPVLRMNVWGREFPNPVGLAAGFDKDAEVPDAMLAQGFGFVEIGSVTPRAQPGNPKKRLFRLSADEAVINRMGFNSRGLEVATANLSARKRRGIVGVNLGKNKETEDAADDYVRGALALAPFADYLVCNVSSPNTPGLRALQGREALDGLVARVQEALGSISKAPPLVFKIAPDLADADLEDVVRVALDRRLAGLIVGNTTLSRPASLRDPQKGEAGGLSGRPLFDLSTRMLAKARALAGRDFVLIGTGGISDARDAYAKIRAGATLVQLYSAMVYRGPGLAADICRTLPALVKADGFASIAEAVGAGPG
ncbi:MAG: quinone-dependent dihydroorotate dehydrogenase [Alphaproteobacteria bacterium]|nr:quinone-dependent dihydroorotate dehydrogenase [Alphaproteobacteria bacterium]